MDPGFQAVCFDAAGGSTPCRVTFESGGLVIEPAGRPAVRWPYPTLACEAGGDEHDWVFVSGPATGDGVARLALRDMGPITTLAARTTGPAHELLAGFEAHRRRHARGRRRGLTAGLVAAAVLVTAGWLFLTRLAPDIAVTLIPPASETLVGEAALAQFVAGRETIAEGPAVDAVRAIMERLVAAIESNPGYSFDVDIVADDAVNAVAFPGGRIVVFSGLLAEAGTAEEVAGVLAHEICHVLHRDGLRQVIGRLGGRALLRLLLGGGDLGGLADRACELDHLAYGRDQEQAADRGGAGLLARAGLEPGWLPTFFERLERREGGRLPAFLSTHPDTAVRVAELRRLGATIPVVDPRPLGIDWNAVRASLE